MKTAALVNEYEYVPRVKAVQTVALGLLEKNVVSRLSFKLHLR